MSHLLQGELEDLAGVWIVLDEQEAQSRSGGERGGRIRRPSRLAARQRKPDDELAALA